MSPLATRRQARSASRIIGVSIVPSCFSGASGEARSKHGIAQLKYLTEHSMNSFYLLPVLQEGEHAGIIYRWRGYGI